MEPASNISESSVQQELNNVVNESEDQKQEPRQLTPTQLEELGNIEKSVFECARSFTEMSKNLRESLHAVSGNSGKYTDTYKLATENLQEQVNESVVSMHSLITKCLELNQDFKKIQEMHTEIKNIRRDVDVLYNLVSKS